MSSEPEHKTYVMDVPQLRNLFGLLQMAGYKIAGPKVRDSAIIMDFLDHFDDLPVGYKDVQNPGKYRLSQDSEPSYFGYAVGPQSIKGILHPAHRRLWKSNSQSNSLTFTAEPRGSERIALFGIRSCDLQALGELDKVFLKSGIVDDAYAAKRQGLLIVSATCWEPGGTCFCTSMGHGPRANEGYDVNLTEVLEGERHFFLADASSATGESILASMALQPANQDHMQRQSDLVQKSRDKISKAMPTAGLPEFLKQNLEHSHWDDVAQRCLSCGNCTMVCPTCFCSTVEDVADLSGQNNERWLRWDSCFTADFSFIHGGPVRPSTRSRYRHWLVHKLSTWHDQFGSSGCVGCGRCISWCPVGIDITEEIKALREPYESRD